MEIPQDAFADLTYLDTLDLSGNRLAVIHATSFRSGPPSLKFLDLSDNVLRAIPYATIRSLKTLLRIHLSRNYITAINGFEDDNGDSPTTPSSFNTNNNNGIHLDELVLDENYIKLLPRQAFRRFRFIGTLSLNGNPLRTIREEAFLGTQIVQLFIRNCDLLKITSTTFQNLVDHLELLDLSHNGITDGNDVVQALTNMSKLINISLIGNSVSHPLPLGFLNSSPSLQYLHVESVGRNQQSKTGIYNEDLKELKYQRSLGMSLFPKPTLDGNEFRDLSMTLERLILTGSNLRSLKSESFQYLPNIKHLDLSSNHISRIEDNSFKPTTYSLQSLDLGNAFDSSVRQLPEAIFKQLSALEKLDLSNNRLQMIPSGLFYSQSELRHLNLQDNAIGKLEPGTFHSGHHKKLENIKMSFNRLTRLRAITFSKLQSLKYLYLDDNHIETIESYAFDELSTLECLDLQGNNIKTIQKAAFRNLPKLTLINLAHNSLRQFSFNIFQHVGDNSILKVNVSYNQLYNLGCNTTQSRHYYAYIKIIDFSHNNISNIDPDYFEPTSKFLRELYFSFNKLTNLSRTMFDEMYYLTTLKMDNNLIEHIDEDSFDDLTSLKVLSLGHNRIQIIQDALFSNIHTLHYLDLTDNKVNDLPDNLFDNCRQIQVLNLASNNITNFPSSALAPLIQNLHRIDLSNNQILHLGNDDLQQYIHLEWLDISLNQLETIENDTFKNHTPSLKILNIADNPFKHPSQTLTSELALKVIEEINLSNTGLTSIPQLNTVNLIRLNLSRNKIGSVEKSSFANLNQLRDLDLSHNDLTHVPSQDVWRMLPKLRSLNLAGNPITAISNLSFVGLHALDDLNIQHLPLNEFHIDGLRPLQHLRILKTNIYNSMLSGPLNVVRVISPCIGLKTLALQFGDEKGRISDLIFKSNAQVEMPPKLRDVILTGKQFHRFGKNALGAIKSRHLKLIFYNTSVESISLETFQSMRSLQYLQLDLSDNSLITMADPISAEIPGSKGIFLQKLNTKDNQWKCDCYIGWIEQWMRLLRQRQCNGYDIQNDHQKCQEEIQHLRFTLCTDKGHKSLLQVLKNDLECAWRSSGFIHSQQFSIIVITNIVHILYLIISFK